MTTMQPGRDGRSRDTRVDGIGFDSPVGIGEITVLLNTPGNTVYKWRSHPSKDDPFPPAEPTSVAGCPWWRWGDVHAWAERTNRLPEDDPVVLPSRAVAS